MTDNPQDRPEERRRTGRTGPLGEDPEETRRESSPESDDATRRVPAEEQRRGGESRGDDETRPVETNRSAEEDKETRVIRTPGARRASEATSGSQTTRRQDATPYPRGYYEAAEEREDRLRDIYGGMDWLASFLGFVFATVAGGVLFGIASLILVPLGISVQIGGQLGAAAITALVLLAVLIFLTYLFGGYVAGRLARFDGGRNGAMSVFWMIVIGFILFAVGAFLPGAAGGNALRDFFQGSLLPALGSILQLGTIGIVIVVVALLIAFLGGIVGGRLGSRYHSEIDRTT